MFLLFIMKTTLLEPTHPHSIPDRSHILTDMAMSNQNPLVTLSEAIAFNLAHPENRIQLDAYEDARFITACARALNQLDITEPERVNELI